jgi:predicted AlkP superfamily pyrophosphatase or phosphodiesterase
MNPSIRRRLRPWTAALAATTAALIGITLTPSSSTAETSTRAKPDRVVIILVDALSREIVNKYDMTNAKALMGEGVNAKNAYLGHVGSVTVVTHNVLTTGLLPKRMGWVSEGYRDNGALASFNSNPYWFTSDWTMDQMFAVQRAQGNPKLADYLHAKRPGSKVITVSPKAYAAWGFGGPGSDSIITFSGRNYDCDGDGVNNWRGPTGVNVPTYLSEPACGRWYVDSAKTKTYDTNLDPAWLYPLDGDRYTHGDRTDHQGGDVWAADAALAAMDNEDWSGIFVSLPGVDKAAHMWGSVNDTGTGLTHVREAAAVADAQIGRIVGHLRDTGQLDNTVVVLTADHGSVPGEHFHGVNDGTTDRGFYNWYYGEGANGTYLKPQPALQPLVDTGNLAQAYSDSQLTFWLKDNSSAKVSEAVGIVAQMPDVSAVWVRQGSRYVLSSPVRWDRMPTKGERVWFSKRAQELVNTAAGPTGPDVLATLVDDTTYSVAGDHGGIQRRTQQIPIVFAGAGLGPTDIGAGVRSVDVMPTVLKLLGISPTAPLDGKAYDLPHH